MNDHPAEPICECATPGFCQRFQIDQTTYAHSVCQGTAPHCSPQKSEAYRRRWREDLERKTGKLPSLPQRIVNAGQAVVAAAVGVAQGTPLLCPAEIAEAREATCRACELCDVKHMLCRHPKCGCPVNRMLKAHGRPGKVELATQKCPMGKWAEWTPATCPSSQETQTRSPDELPPDRSEARTSDILDGAALATDDKFLPHMPGRDV